MSQLCEAGSSELHAGTGSLLVQCKAAPVDEDGEEAPDYGRAIFASCLGVTARPAPADDSGAAELLVDDDVPGLDGVVIGGRDPRSADVIAELGDGETCLHSTGPGFGSRVFCKDQLVAIVVGDDTVINVDRKNKKITVAGFGCVFEMSDAQGIVLGEPGGAALILKNGSAMLKAASVFLGENALSPVAHSVAGPANVVSPSVLVPLA